MRRLFISVTLLAGCSLPAHAQGPAQTFNSIVPSGVYVKTASDCDRLKQNPLKMLRSASFDHVGIRGNEINRYTTGGCTIKSFTALQNTVEANAECMDEGEVTKAKYRFSIKDNKINFGDFDENGRHWRFLCEFNAKNLPKGLQFNNLPGTVEPAMLGGSSPQLAVPGNVIAPIAPIAPIAQVAVVEQNLSAQIETLRRIGARKNIVCTGRIIKDTASWNMDVDKNGKDIFVELPGKDMVRRAGDTITLFSDQVDATPSLTGKGDRKIFVLDYKNYYYPLEVVSIDEKSCNRARMR